LKIVYKKLKGSGALWILSGSTSLAIQGVEIVPNDIDVLTDKAGVPKIYELFEKHCLQAPTLATATEEYRSYYGIYKIGKVKLDVCGEFQYRLKNGDWSIPNHLHKIIWKDYEGMHLPLLTLEQEFKEYANLDKSDKVFKIKKALGAVV
jgi:hypothetical protein